MSERQFAPVAELFVPSGQLRYLPASDSQQLTIAAEQLELFDPRPRGHLYEFSTWNRMHLDYEVAPNAPLVVMGGTLVATAAGGLTGVTSGVLQNTTLPPAVMGLRLARGLFMFSFGFFGKR